MKNLFIALCALFALPALAGTVQYGPAEPTGSIVEEIAQTEFLLFSDEPQYSPTEDFFLSEPEPIDWVLDLPELMAGETIILFDDDIEWALTAFIYEWVAEGTVQFAGHS